MTNIQSVAVSTLVDMAREWSQSVYFKQPRQATCTSDPAHIGTTVPIWQDPAWIAETDDSTLGEQD